MKTTKPLPTVKYTKPSQSWIAVIIKIPALLWHKPTDIIITWEPFY